MHFFHFQLNVSFPATGCQKLFEISDEHKLRMFYEKRMGAEVEADALGDEWKGYIVRISGGNDKQGFPMKQGILTNGKYYFFLYYYFFTRKKMRSHMSTSLGKNLIFLFFLCIKLLHWLTNIDNNVKSNSML